MIIILVRLTATLSALLVVPLALVNWVHFRSDLYISGRQVDVVFPFGDGYAVAVLGAGVILTRLARTLWPRYDWLFAWACILCGLGVTSVVGAVLFKDWAGDRMWTIYAEFAFGIIIAVCGTLLLTFRKRPVARDEQAGKIGRRK